MRQLYFQTLNNLSQFKIVTDMQFNYRHNVGSDIAVVTFTNFNISKVAAKEKLFSNFRLIGGNNPLFELEWIFPSFISSIVIALVINNTCFVCGGLMKNSMKMLTCEENPNSLTKNIRKCTQCGHSHT